MVKHSSKHTGSNDKTSMKSPAGRRAYNIAEKRSLVAEAREKGVQETARNHNISHAVLYPWMLKDFSDLSGTKKRLPGGGRPLKYDASIDITLRDWVVQRMMVAKRVSQVEIKQKALELILPHHPDFRASHAWISRFLRRHNINLKENTYDVTVPNDGDGHNGGYAMNYHEQQQQWQQWQHQSNSNTSPIVSYFTIVKSEGDSMVRCQPVMEEVIEDGLVPIEEDVEIISNCDLMDLGETMTTSDTSSFTHPSESLTMHTSSETVEESRPTNTSNVEFTPVNNTLPLHRKDVDSHPSKSSRRKSYDWSVEVVLRDWILQKTMLEKRRVSHKELRKKALELILPYNPKFLASSFWIRNFLHRHDITLNAVMHGMRCTKSRSTKKKNVASSVLDQENTCPSSELQRHHNHDFSPVQPSICHLQKIGRPRELLKRKINWKRMVLSIPKQNLSQYIARNSKTLRSKGQKSTKKMLSQKQPRKKIRQVMDAASIIDGLKGAQSNSAQLSSATELPNTAGPSTAIASHSDVDVERPSGEGARCDSKKSKKSLGVTSNKRSPSNGKKENIPLDRRTWEISEKRQLVAEASQKGIRATARIHNISFSTLRVWTKQDFGDMPGNKKRLPGGGRPLRYDQSIDSFLKEWVIQKMAMGKDWHSIRDEFKRKAMEMILPYNPNFQASCGWLIKFLTRHKLTLNRATRNNRKHSSPVEFQAQVSIKVEQESPDSSQYVPEFLVTEVARQTPQSGKSKSPKKATTLQGKRQNTTTTIAPTTKRKKKQ